MLSVSLRYRSLACASNPVAGSKGTFLFSINSTKTINHSFLRFAKTDKKKAEAIAKKRASMEEHEKRIDALIDKTEAGKGAKGFKEFQPTMKDAVQDAAYLQYIGVKLPNPAASKNKAPRFYRPEEMIPGKEAAKDLDQVLKQDYSPKSCRFCKHLQEHKRLLFTHIQNGKQDKDIKQFWDQETAQYINPKRLTINALNVPLLSSFLNPHGKIVGRKSTGNCSKHQRLIARTIKKAQHMGFFSFKRSQFKVSAPYQPEDMMKFTGPDASLKQATELSSVDFTPEYHVASGEDTLEQKPDTRRKKTVTKYTSTPKKPESQEVAPKQ